MLRIQIGNGRAHVRAHSHRGTRRAIKENVGLCIDIDRKTEEVEKKQIMIDQIQSDRAPLQHRHRHRFRGALCNYSSRYEFSGPRE